MRLELFVGHAPILDGDLRTEEVSAVLLVDPAAKPEPLRLETPGLTVPVHGGAADPIPRQERAELPHRQRRLRMLVAEREGVATHVLHQAVANRVAQLVADIGDCIVLVGRADVAALERIYGHPSGAAVEKELDYIHPHYKLLISKSPFVVLATGGPEGLDTSPRGDAPGFVIVEDEKTLLLPDRKGNNRIDGLRNILHDPRVSLIFLIPGVDETLRVNGRAQISVDPELLHSLAVDGKPPACALWIRVEQVFFQCGKSMMRSGLWQGRADHAPVAPSAGEIFAALSDGEVDATQYDREKPQRLRDGMY